MFYIKNYEITIFKIPDRVSIGKDEKYLTFTDTKHIKCENFIENKV